MNAGCHVRNSTHNHYYFSTQTQTQKWSEARDFCDSYGGYLTTINDHSEYEFMRSRANGLAFWIGLYRTCEMCDQWNWIKDDSPVSFTMWNAGANPPYPKNDEVSRKHVLVRVDNDNWVNLYGDTQPRRYICEVPDACYHP